MPSLVIRVGMNIVSQKKWLNPRLLYKMHTANTYRMHLRNDYFLEAKKVTNLVPVRNMVEIGKVENAQTR